MTSTSTESYTAVAGQARQATEKGVEVFKRTPRRSPTRPTWSPRCRPWT